MVRKVIDYLVYVVTRVVAGLIQVAGPAEAKVHARRLARLWWRLDRKHRNIALTNLRNSFPDWPQDRIERVGRESFERLLCFIIDVLLTPRFVTNHRWQDHIRLVGFEPTLEMLLTPRQPIIMLTAHYGNFEIMGYTLATLGFPTVSVARPIDNPYLNEYILGVRERHGQEILYKKGATGSMQDVLAGNGVLCFIADQNAGHKGQFANFFGRPASTYKSIGLLAIQFRCPIVIGYARQVGTGLQYEIGVQEMIRPEQWQGQPDELAWITQRYSDAMEAFIRAEPAQYWWIHRRWKSRPPWEKPGDAPKEAGGKYHPKATA
ncbi:MAG: Lipid A biosynthesis lauroyltransferase [Phycisphaerae bacterium]|nr:Lipid A biosynthesis lauroyltransferase [Phycisphaerae bacterium]